MIDKTEFRGIFDRCMSVSKAWCCNSPEDCSWVEIQPKCVIRDFSIDVTHMQQSGVWNADEVDTEFDDFEQAWDYMGEVYPKCRVMDNAGQIYYDFFSEEDDKLVEVD